MHGYVYHYMYTIIQGISRLHVAMINLVTLGDRNLEPSFTKVMESTTGNIVAYSSK